MRSAEPQRLTFIRLAGLDKTGRCFAEYACLCGVIKTIRKHEVDINRVRSCGCLSKEKSTERTILRNTTHGEANRSPEYHAWKGMIQRCYNIENQKYPDYGGRGIAVCEEWRASFPAFLAVLGRKPTPKHSLGRQNNNGNYEPGNVSWETATQQARNTRKNILLTLDGRTQTQSAWAREIGVQDSTLHIRLKTMSVEDALRKPARADRRRK